MFWIQTLASSNPQQCVETCTVQRGGNANPLNRRWAGAIRFSGR